MDTHEKKRLLGAFCVVFAIFLFNGSLLFTEWEVITPPYASDSWQLSRIHFTSLGDGWAVGGNGAAYEHKGILLHYYSGTWLSVDPPFVSDGWDLRGVHFPSPGEGWAVGYNWGMGGVLLHYANGGWTFVGTPDVAYPGWWKLNDVYFISPNEGWAVGEGWGSTGRLLYYLNGSWESVRPPDDLIDSPDKHWLLNGIDFVSPEEGWAVGSFTMGISNPLGGLLLHYSHGLWQNIVPPYVLGGWNLLRLAPRWNRYGLKVMAFARHISC